ncbi:MAG: amidohydrolase [Burkholderiales bacterium]|nr:amidohydrolase [Burkholderiales bacterium]
MNVLPACSCCPQVPDGFFAAVARKSAATRRPAAKAKAGAKRAPAASPRRIDVHNHIAPPGYLKMKMESKLEPPNAHRDRLYAGWHPGLTLESMDEGGTQAAITSITDGTFISLHPHRVRIAREVNEFAAKMQQDHPGRFGHFATLPMPDVDACLAEIEYALDVLGFDGVDIRTSYRMQWLGDQAFVPIYEELNRRKAIVYSHPHEPFFAHDLIPGVAGSTIEFCSDTSRAIASVLFGGIATRFAQVRFIFSHGGGTVPFLLDRFINQARRGEHPKTFPKGIVHELKKFYYEVAQALHPGALDALLRMAPLNHVLFGTDYPHFHAKETGRRLAAYEGFDEAALAAINRGNALKLFPRFR